VIAATVAVTGIATAAVTAIARGQSSTLSPQDVNQLLAQAGGTPEPTTTPTSAGSGDVVTGLGDLVATLTPGIVTVHCDGDVATLVSWSPNPGFRSKDAVRGPAAEVSVRFESDSDGEFTVSATCSAGTATARVGADDGGHGGKGGGHSGDG
jgi:hypothetical protein